MDSEYVWDDLIGPIFNAHKRNQKLYLYMNLLSNMAVEPFKEFCPSCGTPNTDNKGFCSKCGESLKKTEPPPIIIPAQNTPSEGNQQKTRRNNLLIVGGAIVFLLLIVVIFAGGLVASIIPQSVVGTYCPSGKTQYASDGTKLIIKSDGTAQDGLYNGAWKIENGKLNFYKNEIETGNGGSFVNPQIAKMKPGTEVTTSFKISGNTLKEDQTNIVYTKC
nr:zinc-ribbon domain-containing protein [uncultured Methanoregula sp.]